MMHFNAAASVQLCGAQLISISARSNRAALQVMRCDAMRYEESTSYCLGGDSVQRSDVVLCDGNRGSNFVSVLQRSDPQSGEGMGCTDLHRRVQDVQHHLRGQHLQQTVEWRSDHITRLLLNIARWLMTTV